MAIFVFIVTVLFGLALLSVGIFLFVWEGRRRFNRRNFAGSEQFRSHGERMKARLLEKLVGGIAIFLFVAGSLTVLLVGLYTFSGVVR